MTDQKPKARWLEIESRFLAGEPPRLIAEDYDVKPQAISDRAYHQGWVQKRRDLGALMYDRIAELIPAMAARVLEEQLKIALADMADFADWKDGELVLKDSATLDKSLTSLVSEVSQTADGVKIKLHSKDRALDSLIRNLGLFQLARERAGINPEDDNTITLKIVSQDSVVTINGDDEDGD